MAGIENWLYSAFSDVINGGTTEMRINCPFCKSRVGESDDSHHLYISLTKPVCHCFKCEYGTSWTRLIMDIEDISFPEAMGMIRSDAFVPLYMLLENAVEVLIRPEIKSMPDNFVTVNDALSSSKGLAVKSALMAKLYAERRLKSVCIDWAAYLDRWGVWTDANGFGKIVFPVERGWWQSRSIYRGNGLKYVSASMPKESRLYNYEALELYDSVKIAEGVISAACLGNDAIALCGKAATPKQLKRLGDSRVKNFVVCLDSDAKRNALELSDSLLRLGKNVTVRLYSRGDPASSNNYTEHEYSFATSVMLQIT